MKNITRNNYEIYFIDFLEGSMNEDMLTEFNEFISNNPDLLDELIDLQEFKNPSLSKEIFKRKKNILLPEINNGDDITDENIFSFMIADTENDLNELDAKRLDRYVNANVHVKKDHEKFKNVQLKPFENDQFLLKEKLYKKDNKVNNTRLITAFKYLSAAAILFFMVMGIILKYNESIELNNFTENAEKQHDNIRSSKDSISYYKNTKKEIIPVKVESNIVEEKNSHIMLITKDETINLREKLQTADMKSIKPMYVDNIPNENVNVRLLIQDHFNIEPDYHLTIRQELEIFSLKNTIRGISDLNKDKKFNHWDLFTLASRTINTLAQDSLLTIEFTEDGKFAAFAIDNEIFKYEKFRKN